MSTETIVFFLGVVAMFVGVFTVPSDCGWFDDGRSAQEEGTHADR